jgi:Tfp pilus assembly protein PilO
MNETAIAANIQKWTKLARVFVVILGVLLGGILGWVTPQIIIDHSHIRDLQRRVAELEMKR